ncbi:MAG: OmpW/AlkL family protein [Pseudomonadales bacterium]
MKNALLCAAISAAILNAPQLRAHQSGDLIVRAGLASVQPNDSASGTLGSLNAGVKSNSQLGLTATYMLSDHLGLELLAATPFTHDITSNGSVIGETKQLPPTLSVQYYPMQASSAYQPYVGVGVNYTAFFEEQSSLGNLELDDSWGASVQAGIDYHISDNVLLNAAVWYIDIDTDAKLNGNSVGTVSVDPWVYMIGVGYKF